MTSYLSIDGVGPAFLEALQQLVDAHVADLQLAVLAHIEKEPVGCPRLLQIQQSPQLVSSLKLPSSAPPSPQSGENDYPKVAKGDLELPQSPRPVSSILLPLPVPPSPQPAENNQPKGDSMSTSGEDSDVEALVAERHQQLINVFHALDGDNSGSINANELRRALGILGLPSARVVKMLRLADRDRSGEIELSEWIAVISRNDIGGIAEFLEIPEDLEAAIQKLRSLGKGETQEKEKCIILPLSPFRMMWDFLIIMSCIFIATEFPFISAWHDTIPEHTVNMLKVVEFAIDGIFVLDIILNFFTGYFDELGQLVLEHKAVAKHYLRTWFAIDLVSTVPMDVVTSVSAFNSQILKVLKFLKLLRVLKMMKIGSVDSSLVSDYVADAALSSVAQTIHRRSSLLLYMVLGSHWMSCGMKLVDEGFMTGFQDVQGHTWREYLVAWYWAMTTLTTVGYGDITPESEREIAFVIFAMVVGGVFYGYVIGTIASMVANSDLNSAAYYERMEIVHAWMAHHGLPWEMKRRLRRHFKALMEQQSAANEAGLWADLTQELQMDVGAYIVRDIVKSNPLFDRLGIGAIVQLQSVLKHVMMLPNQRVTSQGEVGTAMYMIDHGLLQWDRLDGKNVPMGPGESFGEEIILGFREDYQYTIRVIERARLEVLDENDFCSVFQCMPRVVERMKRNALSLNPEWDMPDRLSCPSSDDIPKRGSSESAFRGVSSKASSGVKRIMTRQHHLSGSKPGSKEHLHSVMLT